MKTKCVEATNGFNWGKFLVAQFTDEEWARKSEVDPLESGVIGGRGWSRAHVFVMDLQTGEGAMFAPWGLASHDLNEKHKIWVCPMFEPFLNWFYDWWKSERSRYDVVTPGHPFECRISALPDVVEVDPDQKEAALYGRRREGRAIEREEGSDEVGDRGTR